MLAIILICIILTVIIDDLHSSGITNINVVTVSTELNGEIMDCTLLYNTVVHYGDVQAVLLIQAAEV